MIPKVIYYAWFGGNPLPNAVKENIESWRNMNPDFEIVQINESRTDLFDYTDYDFAQDAYTQKKWAFVSDIARLHVIYENGGVYLDTDVELLKPLDDLLAYSEIWARENRHTLNTGLILAATAKSQNIKNILAIYKKKLFSPNNLKNISTVTIISKYFWQKGLNLGNSKIVTENNVAFFPTRYFAPVHYWGGGKISMDTYGMHKYSASWVNSKNSILFTIKKVLRYTFNQAVLSSYLFAKIIAKVKYK